MLAAYDQAGQTMRHYATLRFAQLSALMAVSAALATTLTANSLPNESQREAVRIVGALTAALFLLMQERAVDHWKAAERSARALEEQLGISVVTEWSSRGLLSATNATRVIHVLITGLWLILR